ncbi:MAG: LysM peptidoglycan-binding domain-containing protein [Bacilli bacterium]|nr:LysM peptidoglycan-binding domain-containing protein [Bacilli bacterium]
MIELIVIDAGHGGIDSGAVGNGLEEKDLNLKVAKYIYNRLQELNIPSVITRTDDEYLPKDKRINRIKNITNNNPNTLLISNHMNAGTGEGAEVVYSLKNNDQLSSLILEKIGQKGQIKRRNYQRRLPENPNQDYYYILRESNSREPILIEYGFIDNKKDAEKLKNNLEEYGEAVVEAITEYLGVPYENEMSEKAYIVKKGDTLYSISKKYNISVDEIKRMNQLKSNLLTIGQVLVLEDIKPNEYYIVQKGDTLWSIAKNNQVSIEDIIEANGLTNSNLAIGQELFIPTANKEPEIELVPDEFELYKVQKGDSLWLISKQYDITVPDLVEINNLSDLNIQIGQTLIIPKQQNTIQVQQGDTLWSIAKKYNLSIEKLKEINQLENNLLSIGQILKIK